MKELKPAVVMTLLCVVLTGGIFPAVIWGVGQIFFPLQANGSFIQDSEGRVVGSRLIGQSFSSSVYFHPRPSAAGSGYDAASSGGTNLGPISRKLVDGLPDDPSTPNNDESFVGFRDLAKKYREENMLASDTKLPADAITRSASGLDPHISAENALLQAARVAKKRGVSRARIEQLIAEHTEERFLGLFGERRVNVLELNIALDQRRAGQPVETRE